MTTFPAHPYCTACPLYANAQHPGIATRPCDQTAARLAAGGTPLPKALLIVGEAPGRQEDEQDAAFVGQVGKYLHRIYIDALRLDSLADIYLANACRCRPVGNATPSDSQIRRCYPHILQDITILQQHYTHLTILCTGASATRSVLNTRLEPSFNYQGRLHHWDWDESGREFLQPTPVFSTYHPGNLLPGREANRLAAIKAHLYLLHDHLREARTVAPDAVPYIINPPASATYPRLSLDIETYGACSQYPAQTCFHPQKSIYFDKPNDLILTAALAAPGRSEVMVFNFLDLNHRRNLLGHLLNLRGDLVGMNIKFDLLYLRAADSRFRHHLTPIIPLIDLSVLNYLHSEQRPERSLKALAPLLGIAEYDESQSLKHYRHPTPFHPDLCAYNAKDAWATLRAVEYLEAQIRREFPNSSKLTPFNRRWYSRLLWLCVLMEEAGVSFNTAQLDALDYNSVLKAALIYSELRHKYDIPLGGPGSEKAVRNLYLRAVEEAGLVGDARLQHTPRRKVISVSQENASLLLQTLDAASPTAYLLRRQQEYEALQSIVTRYTRPILHGSKRTPVGSRIMPQRVAAHCQIAYPSWFPVPAPHEDQKTSGGTIQGRITSKGPACQTLPKPLKACLTSRFSPGFLLGIDLSQIELRTAALLSGDPLMIQEYLNGIDRHSQTAFSLIQCLLQYLVGAHRSAISLGGSEYSADELDSFLQSDAPRQYKRFDLLRQMGKTTNFLIIYGGSPRKLQGTVAEDLGLTLPLTICQSLVDAERRRYPRLNAWQQELLEQACQHRRIELPLTGQSRIFLGSRRGIRETYRSEILNFPIQCTAANTMLDLQYNLMRRLETRIQRSLCGLNIYDAVYVDGPRVELEPVISIIQQVFSRSEYWDMLQERLDRQVPLGYDISVLIKDALPIATRYLTPTRS